MGSRVTACRQLHSPDVNRDDLQRYRELFADRCYLLAELHRGPNDERDLQGESSWPSKLGCRWWLPMMFTFIIRVGVRWRMCLPPRAPVALWSMPVSCCFPMPRGI